MAGLEDVAVEGLAVRSLYSLSGGYRLIQDFARCDLWTGPEPVVME
ncbi:hypothetical protein [Paenibacillus sp. FSL R5-0486]